MFSKYESELAKTDPEFVELFDNFAFDEVINMPEIGRVFPFLNAVNDFLKEQGIVLPLEGQSQTTTDNRLEKGSQAQVDVFGEHMRDFWKSGAEESRHINRWLADNCFGDYYTRTGLNYAERRIQNKKLIKKFKLTA
jgi:4-carboxymuconolactone decarboxylase